MSILTRIGIGAATVDLRVPETVEQGETISGELYMEGGAEAQDGDGVYAAIRSEYENDDGRRIPYTLAEYTLIDEPFTIHPEDERTTEVELLIPDFTPVTTLPAQDALPPVWIETSFDVDWSVDPSDRDELVVEPAGTFATIHSVMVDRFGFSTTDSGPQQVGIGHRPYMVEYSPTDACDWELEHIKLYIADPEGEGQDGVLIRVDVDKEGLILDDHVRVDFASNETDPDRMEEALRDILDRCVEA